MKMMLSRTGAKAGMPKIFTVLSTPLSWADWPDRGREIFEGFRSPAGERLVLERNLFVEAVLPASIIRRANRWERKKRATWRTLRKITKPPRLRSPRHRRRVRRKKPEDWRLKKP